jgi:D-sedoheptulose 7-phosphate isomerase
MRINFKITKVESRALIEELTGRYPVLTAVANEIDKAASCLIKCYNEGHKLLICGNGGSSSDSEHIAGELMKGFEKRRPLDDTMKNRLTSISGDRGPYLSAKLQQALPAISLVSHAALMTAVANDNDADLIFAQQVVGYGVKGDVLLGISTSGNAQNVMDAIITAKAKGMTIIGLTGETGGKIKPFCDILINVPGTRTSYIQELHLPVYHTLCLIVENHFFENKKT